jgi:hypothetical protein
MYCDAFVCFIFIVSSPLFFSIDTETADDTAEYDYVVDDQTTSVELPGKQNLLDHPDTAYSFSLLLALE